MLDKVEINGVTYRVGDVILIVTMNDSNGSDPQAHKYNGRSGIIREIDDFGQLHGSWGGLAVIPEMDNVKIIGRVKQ